jgi:hypothetical protein
MSRKEEDGIKSLTALPDVIEHPAEEADGRANVYDSSLSTEEVDAGDALDQRSLHEALDAGQFTRGVLVRRLGRVNEIQDVNPFDNQRAGNVSDLGGVKPFRKLAETKVTIAAADDVVRTLASGAPLLEEFGRKMEVGSDVGEGQKLFA